MLLFGRIRDPPNRLRVASILRAATITIVVGFKYSKQGYCNLAGLASELDCRQEEGRIAG